ncbi:MAG: Maf family protein [Candidatus Electryonea clarkiae]|nr:Maf family protein [Candidatus Electryonea clarkiae]MDP8288993.1 Maf family protein [Candidatus Electryonea clarkiae]
MIITSIHWTLASGSPRRLALLRQLGIEPTVIQTNVEEIQNHSDPYDTVLVNAEKKAGFVEKQLNDGVMLAADTIVVLKGRLIGKPENEKEAVEHLSRLSGTWHEVITGYVLYMAGEGKFAEGTEMTRVHFRSISFQEIETYISTGEPFDKAGGYGMQGQAGAFVDKINGCYFNVVGLPLARIVEDVLRKLED